MALSVWGTDDNNVATDWNNYTASDPVTDVLKARRTISNNTGSDGNSLVLGYFVHQSLMNHPDIIDRVKYGQTAGAPAKANLATLAALFEVDRILVMNAIQNTAKKGQTSSHSFIGGKHALLAYSAPSPGLMTPSAGYTFSWTGLMGNGIEGNRIRQYRMENLSSDRVEIDMSFDAKLVCADLGYFFNGIVA